MDYKVDFCDEANEIISELTKEKVKLIKEKQELLQQLKLITKMCKAIGTFENGVKWRGMDEGEMQAEGVICDSEKLIRKYKEGE